MAHAAPLVQPTEAAPPREWWQVWAQRRAAWWAARPVLALRWARIRAVGLWVGLVWLLGLLVLVPDVRLSVRAWLGCAWVVIAWFFLARTKTLTWSAYLRFFTACIPWSIGIGVLSTWLAATVLDVRVGSSGPMVGIASVTEETLKLVPVALVALLAPRRASRFATTDWLLLGLASGTAFLLAEETLRRLRLSGGGLVGLLERLLNGGRLPDSWIRFGTWPVPSDWDQSGAGFGGHGVVTAIVAGLVGLALVAARHVRGRVDRTALLVRVGAVVVPVMALVVAIADHAAYNGTYNGGGSIGGGATPYWLDPATTNVPWWIRATWSAFGHGHHRPAFFVLLAVVALLVDGARLARVPSAALVETPRPDWVDQAIVRCNIATATWPAALRRAPAVVTLAVLGTAWVVVRDWTTAVAAFAAEPGESRRVAAQRGLTAVTAQRAARELGYERLAGPVDITVRRGVAAGAIVVLLLGALVLAPVTAAGLDTLYDHPSWLAGVMDAIGRWWHSQSLGTQILVGAGVVALVALSGGSLGVALGASGVLTWGLDKSHGIATWLRDPRQATRDYLLTATPFQMVMDGVAIATTFAPGSFIRSRGAAAVRGAVDDVVEDPGLWLAQKRSTVQNAPIQNPVRAGASHQVSKKSITDQVTFQANEHTQALTQRQAAAATHSANRAAVTRELDVLRDAGLPVTRSDLVDRRFDETVRRLEDAIETDPSLSPERAAELLGRVDGLEQVLRAERDSLTALSRASADLGEAAGRDALRSQGADIVVDGAGAGRDTIDIVGLTRERDQLLFVEAKGGGSQLSSSGRVLPDMTRAPQGSPAYLADVVRVDKALQQWLRANPDIAQGLVDGTVTPRYQLVQAAANGTVRIFELTVDRSLILKAIP
ncbi:hypothetical protein [Cellulomonas xiejunii]|uniref:Uncharacterized protein n=1 Tax=Cellulomonas xiejunii TaxID=2968083 RepID=A0ABY5KNW3_9CELL|nr:hypothetical protein [Cellulomonas xiejunii]MCC2319564.1 hypothetical protein [Cellulomonas xiejunii]UUI71490.1 hypothetical protein NP048_17120 [Cellulomonas xiejunii]